MRRHGTSLYSLPQPTKCTRVLPLPKLCTSTALYHKPLNLQEFENTETRVHRRVSDDKRMSSTRCQSVVVHLVTASTSWQAGSGGDVDTKVGMWRLAD
jgi:hypothetical protein